VLHLISVVGLAAVQADLACGATIHRHLLQLQSGITAMQVRVASGAARSRSGPRCWIVVLQRVVAGSRFSPGLGMLAELRRERQRSYLGQIRQPGEQIDITTGNALGVP
jgi:hypothetical protein